MIAQFGGNNNSSNANTAANAVVPAFDARASSDEIKIFNPIAQKIAPIWPMNSTIDLSIYVGSSAHIPSLATVNPKTLVLREKGFALGDWKESRTVDTRFFVPKEVHVNGTLWAHFYVALHDHPLDPAAKDYDTAKAYYFSRPLSQILPKKKIVKTKNLLAGSDGQLEARADEIDVPKLGTYYHPNFTMSFIPDSGTQMYPAMHPAIRRHVELERTGARDASGQNSWYYPILFVNTFWQLRDHMTELNSSVTSLPLHITLNNLNNWKFSLYASIDEGVKQNQRQIANGGPVPAAGDGSEFEEFKRVLVDTNFYLLCTTVGVTILHTIFEALAFKNDIVGFRSCFAAVVNHILVTLAT